MYSTSGKRFAPAAVENCFSHGVIICKVLLLLVILFNKATCAQPDQNFASVPKCPGSFLEDQVEIPKSFFVSSEADENSTGEALQVKLTNHTTFRCGKGIGRASILNTTKDIQQLRPVLTLFQTGYLLHDKTYYSQEHYCLLSIKTENVLVPSIAVKICEPNCSSKRSACIQKCCDPDNVWNLENYISRGTMRCEKPAGGNKWKPALHHETTNEKISAAAVANINVRYKYAHPAHFCSDQGFFIMTLKNYNDMEASPFHILNNGKVEVKVGPRIWEEVAEGQYCVDGAMNFDPPELTNDNGSAIASAGHYSGDDVDTVLLVCSSWLNATDTSYAEEENSSLLYVVAMLVASVFLFLTAVVYALLWNRQSVHGWTFLGYVVSLLFTFLFLSAAHLSTFETYDCTLVGIACHFFFISCFSWLTALNFDIFWTFRSLNPYPGRKQELLRFLYYSIFAVGTPTTIVSVGLILQKIYGDDPNSDVIVPRYGVTRCTMDRSADLPYLFGPISVLLGCNLLLFPSTLYLVYKSQKVAKLSGMKSSMLKHKIRFFGKLFMLAGITWIFEVVSWACLEPGKPVHWIWKFLDLVNILQAIAIFVVFVCNRKTLEELADKFPRLERINTILVKASGGGIAGINTARKQSNNSVTHASSVFEVPGLDTLELR